MNLLSKLWLSLLPPRYRRARPHEDGTYLRFAAGVTAFFELVIACIFYARGFIDYIPNSVIGPAAFLEYFFTPAGFIVFLILADGAMRLLASVGGQSLGLFPLYFVAWANDWFDRRAARKRQPPLVSDVVEKIDDPSGGLRIRSCRPRKNWDKWMTIMYEEKLYEIFGAELKDLPRPYLYLLRIKPESKVIRGLHRYHPDEVFQLDEDAAR